MILFDVLGFFVAAVLGSWLLGLVVTAIRTGRIRHTNSTATFSLRQQPVQFCLLVLFFILFAGACLYAAILRALSIWHNLSA
ncbi:MAG: hypothetical protein LBE21_01640 [Pseudomonadales bacterium]|jgi:hypothetical protein|nr:hypothetical protein [Pseudomonadales bacterium]